MPCTRALYVYHQEYKRYSFVISTLIKKHNKILKKKLFGYDFSTDIHDDLCSVLIPTMSKSDV